MNNKKLAMLLLFTISTIVLFFQSCSNQHNQNQSIENHLAQGDSITKIAFDTLRKELMYAMSTKGTIEAIDYCKINAVNITSIYEEGKITSIKRAALKFRNPSNASDSIETLVLNKYIESKNKGETLTSQLIKQGEITHYFKPILLKNACLSCHGDPVKDIKPEVLSQIKKIYQEDKATGFNMGDVRGIWHVVFENKK